MSQKADRLYELLPVIYRQRDAEQGLPLRELLRVIAEQVNWVEADIDQLYENWFIETCQDWVVPYIAELIGYQLVREAGEPGDIAIAPGQQRHKILIPRREVANTIRYRRRKGTLALLELLANDVAGWSARAVEFYKLLGWTQHLNHLQLGQGRTVDLRQGDALDRLDSPFDELAHTVDVRRITSPSDLGRYNLPHVGLFVWRLKVYSVTQTSAECVDRKLSRYTFSILGNDTPLYTRPQKETDPTQIADELNLPVPIRRKAFEARKNDYYGIGKSLQIWVGVAEKPQSPEEIALQEVTADRIVVADLSDWQYRSDRQVAVDPVLGRIIFPSAQWMPQSRSGTHRGVWVTYHYGFSTEIGGGEYDRLLSQPAGAIVYRVGDREAYKSLNNALDRWRADNPKHAVIEIAESSLYVEPIRVELGEGTSLQIRAANRTRPVIRQLNWTPEPDAICLTGAAGSRFTLDGLLITGRGIWVRGDLAKLTIRHCTLVPGWEIDCDCHPKANAEEPPPSLDLDNVPTQVVIDRSILGRIQVTQNEVTAEPIPIDIGDSILDATAPDREALGALGCPVAHAVLTVTRTTILGKVRVHACQLAENSIFDGKFWVARRQVGCMRFCYVTPNSRTPRRYNCQPDLVEVAIAQVLKQEADRANAPPPTEVELNAARQRERDRVRPQFNSTRYGTPTYCQLACTCAEEIERGADDESEMGVFHDLYQPQRAANLRARLDEYTPADMETGTIYAS
jgi:hypothetical protein